MQPYTAPWSYKKDGPLHRLLGTLITEANVKQLGFVSWTKCENLLERSFIEGDAGACRLAFVVAQWVVLAKRFRVRSATSGPM